jgi:hypothetical protein
MFSQSGSSLQQLLARNSVHDVWTIHNIIASLVYLVNWLQEIYTWPTQRSTMLAEETAHVAARR